jgi:colanic acid biosynthesis glycosyl transferase WcaI
MKILIHGINYSPELTGIGKYSGEMGEWLAMHGHEVRVVTAPPYYPMWKIGVGYSGWRFKREVVVPLTATKGNGLKIYRCPLWVPAQPSGIRRILHLASFALSSLPVMLRQAFWKPDIVIAIEPPIMCAPAALLISKLCRSKSWLHVQDFEVDAAFNLGILPFGYLRNTFLSVERYLMSLFDRISTVSPMMLDRLACKGVPQINAILFPNWVDAQVIFPMQSASPMRAELGIADNSIVALYSGNMGEKQGLEIVLDTARNLDNKYPIRFILCGDGAARIRLQKTYAYLQNVLWLPLQPIEKLNGLLNVADIHLLPQRANVSDLVMPSKLTGMLSSGRPILATANAGTQIAQLVSTCGIVVEPGNAQMFLQGLLELVKNPQQRKIFGVAARQASLSWDKHNVLRCFEEQLLDLCNK